MPEKIIAFIGKNFPIIAIGTGLFLLWGKVLPYLIAVLEGSLIALGYAAILFVIILLAMSPEVRMVSYNIFRKFTRGLVEAMVKLDPLGNMKTYRDDIRDKELPNIMKNLQKISGLVERVRSQIAKNLESARSYLRKAEAAKSKEDERSMNLFLEQAGTYKTSAEALTPMLNTIENQQAFYVKVKELAEDKNLTGIIVELPLPPGYNRDDILKLIPQDKDVDVLNGNRSKRNRVQFDHGRSADNEFCKKGDGKRSTVPNVCTVFYGDCT